MAIFVHSKEDFLENHLEIKWPSFKVKHVFNMLGFHVPTFFHNLVAEFLKFLVIFVEIFMTNGMKKTATKFDERRKC